MITLNFHRRHGLNCAGKHPAKSYTSQPEERKKGWKACKCPIYASGSLNRVASRVATKQTDWDAAAVMMAPYIAANSWNLPLDTPPPTPPSPAGKPVAVPPKGASTVQAADAYIKAHEKALSAWNTIRQKRYLMIKLKDYATDPVHSLPLIRDWTTPDVKSFAATWEVSNITANRMLAGAKAFFEWCVGEEFIKTNPARYKQLRNRATREMEEGKPRLPFTDEELQRMYDGCRDFRRELIREWPKKKDGRQVEAIDQFRSYACKYTGEDLLDFICVSIFTGLRISDVATFNMERLLPSGECRIRTIKNHANVYVPLPPFLVERLRNRAKIYGPQIFGTYRTKDINTVTNNWRKPLNRLWALNGPWTEKPEHHRFRHTFVRVLLQKNTPIIKIAELIGDTEETVVKHYSNWVPERQEGLTAAVREAFAEFPNPYQPKRAKVLPLKQEQSA